MKKYYSKKERQQKKNLRLIIVAFLVIIVSMSVLLSFYGSNLKDTNYTAEQLLHDHDGDGIPEH